ncbi:hypothetical protein KY289_026899 [Solanum tuberosum]|nr:hypothetical protein KY289_026899 [Solanum tuberosum]
MAASKRTCASASTSPTIPAIVLCVDDLVSCGVRRGKHITSQSSSSKSKTSTIAKKSSFPKLSPKLASKVQSSKIFKKKQVPSPVSSSSFLQGSDAENLIQSNPPYHSLPSAIRDTQQKLAKKEVTVFYINGKSGGLSFTCTMRNTPIHLVHADVAQILGIPSEGWGHYVKLEVLNQDKNGHALPCGFWMASIFEAFDVPVQVWDSQTVKDVVGRVNRMALHVSMRRLDTPLQRLQHQLAEKENELVTMMTTHQIEKETWEARVVALQHELA